jgi:hypothetical protein
MSRTACDLTFALCRESYFAEAAIHGVHQVNKPVRVFGIVQQATSMDHFMVYSGAEFRRVRTLRSAFKRFGAQGNCGTFLLAT